MISAWYAHAQGRALPAKRSYNLWSFYANFAPYHDLNF